MEVCAISCVFVCVYVCVQKHVCLFALAVTNTGSVPFLCGRTTTVTSDTVKDTKQRQILTKNSFSGHSNWGMQIQKIMATKWTTHLWCNTWRAANSSHDLRDSEQFHHLQLHCRLLFRCCFFFFNCYCFVFSVTLCLGNTVDLCRLQRHQQTG